MSEIKEQLEPCPFCGETKPYHILMETEHGRFYVHCPECETCGPALFEQSEAVSAWNTRAQQSPAPANTPNPNPPQSVN